MTGRSSRRSEHDARMNTSCSASSASAFDQPSICRVYAKRTARYRSWIVTKASS